MTAEQALASVIVSSGQLQAFWQFAQLQVQNIQQNDICYGLGYGSLVPTLQNISNLACQVAHQAVNTALAYATRCGTVEAWSHYSNAQNSTVAACSMDQSACHMGEFAGDPFGQVYQSGNPSGYCLNYHYFNCVGNQVSSALYAYNEALAAAACKPPAPPLQPRVTRSITRALPHFYNIFGLRGAK